MSVIPFKEKTPISTFFQLETNLCIAELIINSNTPKVSYVSTTYKLMTIISYVTLTHTQRVRKRERVKSCITSK